MDADKLQAELTEAEKKAFDSLARYKFVMFGYWAGVWVHLNRLQETPSPNPFRELVNLARTPDQIKEGSVFIEQRSYYIRTCKNPRCPQTDGVFETERADQVYCGHTCRNRDNVYKSHGCGHHFSNLRSLRCWG